MRDFVFVSTPLKTPDGLTVAGRNRLVLYPFKISNMSPEMM